MAILYEQGRFLRGLADQQRDPVAYSVTRLWAFEGFAKQLHYQRHVINCVGRASWTKLQAVRQVFGKEVFFHALYGYWRCAMVVADDTSRCGICKQKACQLCIKMVISCLDFPELDRACTVLVAKSPGRVSICIISSNQADDNPLRASAKFSPQ